MKRLMTFVLILAQVSCGTRFDLHGVDHEKLTKKSADITTGCMKDSDCDKGQKCATVKGEYPGSCANITDGNDVLVGALILGAAAAIAAGNNSGGGGGSGYAPQSGNDVWVNGYTRSDGVYVPGYYRSAPDATRVNNYGSPSRYSTGLYDRDTDGDGIYNQYDVDDDGDGINDDFERD